MARTLKQLQAEQKAELKRLEIIEKQNNSLKTQRSVLDGRTKAAKDYDKALKMSNIALAKHEEKLQKLKPTHGLIIKTILNI